MNRHFAALSGIAIMLVVLNHAIQLGMQYTAEAGYPAAVGWQYGLLVSLEQLGSLAVPIFLFISGCFFAYAAQAQQKVSYKIIATNLTRIFWPYLFWSILFYVLLYFLTGEIFSWTVYIKDLLVGYPYNFVPLLAFYYLFSPVFVLLTKRFPVPFLLVVGIYQLFVLNVVHPGILGFVSPPWAAYLTPPVIRSTLAYWAIYFPLGMVYSFNMKVVVPWLQRVKWCFIAVTIIFYVFNILDAMLILSFPLANILCSFACMFILPVIRRDTIPLVHSFEKIGNRSYGLYLSHLIAVNLVLIGCRFIYPALFYHPIVLSGIVFSGALALPWMLMNAVYQLPNKKVYRYVFS